MSNSKLPVRKTPRISVIDICDSSGKAITVLPDFVTSDFMRTTFRKDKRELKVSGTGDVTVVAAALVRAQIPYLVTLFVYKSAFQMTPTEMEWILYAPGDLKSASTQALMLWKRWFKPGRKAGDAASGIDMAQNYPLVRDGLVVEPIDDKFFDECWRYVSKRPHKAVGHPDRPWGFTCLEEDFKVYNHTDRQQGLIHRIS